MNSIVFDYPEIKDLTKKAAKINCLKKDHINILPQALSSQ